MLTEEMDMAIFHVEQDVMDLEEEVIQGKMGHRAIALKLLDIADKLGGLQNDALPQPEHGSCKSGV